jgi:hypothetical protein
MSPQPISERKIRQAARETGLPLIQAMRHSNNLWFGWVREGEGHWHVEIQPKTWEWEYHPECGFSSCRENTYGPGVVPNDPSVIAAHERAEEERRAVAVRADEEWHEVATQWKQATEEWLAR